MAPETAGAALAEHRRCSRVGVRRRVRPRGKQPGQYVQQAERSVAQGEVYVTPSLAAGIPVTLTRSPAPQDPRQGLTERESEILKLVVQGLINREIGERLRLSEKTIEHCITNILEKLHVRSRMEAAMPAIRGGRHDAPKQMASIATRLFRSLSVL
jgi:DNA-binding NarL/FixJ family response regulator